MKVFSQLRLAIMIKYFAFKDKCKKIKDFLFFRCFANVKRYTVKIILNDFAGHPLYRKKHIFNTIIDCGLGNLLENMEKYKAGVDFEVILVVNQCTADKRQTYVALKEKYPFVKEALFRDNDGRDIGAYNEGYQYFKKTDYNGDVVFMNTSARGPYHDFWLLKYAYLFHKTMDIGLCGISLNSAPPDRKDSELFVPHVQTFFVYTSMRVLRDVFSDVLPGANLTLKEDLIWGGEIKLSRRVLDKGYGICSKMFERFVYYKGGKWTIPKGDIRWYNPVFNQLANKI